MSDVSPDVLGKEPDDFQFVISSGPPRKPREDREGSRKIKSYVMRKYQRGKKKLNQAQDPPFTPSQHGQRVPDTKAGQSDPDVPTTDADPSTRQPLGGSEIDEDLTESDLDAPSESLRWGSEAGTAYWPLTEPSLQSQIDSAHKTNQLARTRLDDSRIDPFGVCLLGPSYENDILMSFYEAPQTMLRLFAYDHTNNWRRESFSEPVFLHAALSLTALCYMTLARNKMQMSQIHLQYSNSTIRLLNLSMSDPARRYSDSVLAAIGVIAAIEIVTGERAAIDAHFSALQTIVQKRGGLQSLGMNGGLEKLITWLDMLDTYLTCTPSRFPSASSVSYTQHQIGNNRHVDSVPTHPAQATSSYQLDITPLFEIRNSLADLSLQNEIPALRPASYAATLARSQSQILALLPAHATYPPSHVPIPMRRKLIQSFHLSALIYISLFLTTNDLSKQENPERVTHLLQLQYALILPSSTAIDFDPPISTNAFRSAPPPPTTPINSKRWFWNVSTRLWFWIMFVGGVAAEDLPQRGFYRQRLANMCVQLNLQTWDEAREFLETVAWVSRTCEHKFRKLWVEIPRV